MSDSTAPSSSPTKQLITLRLAAAGFGQHWRLCSLVSDYLATFTSELLDKTEAHENLVSTVLNELLEVVFRRNAGTGQITVTLVGDETHITVKIVVPVEEEHRRCYEEMAELVAGRDIDDLHQKRLSQLDMDEPDLSFGLLELATVYDAILEVVPVEERSVLLQLPFRLTA